MLSRTTLIKPCVNFWHLHESIQGLRGASRHQHQRGKADERSVTRGTGTGMGEEHKVEEAKAADLLTRASIALFQGILDWRERGEHRVRGSARGISGREAPTTESGGPLRRAMLRTPERTKRVSSLNPHPSTPNPQPSTLNPQP